MVSQAERQLLIRSLALLDSQLWGSNRLLVVYFQGS